MVVVAGTRSQVVVMEPLGVDILVVGILAVCTAISESHRTKAMEIVREAVLGRVPLRWWSSIALRRWGSIIPRWWRSSVVWLLRWLITMLLALPREERHVAGVLVELRTGTANLMSAVLLCNLRSSWVKAGPRLSGGRAGNPFELDLLRFRVCTTKFANQS